MAQPNLKTTVSILSLSTVSSVATIITGVIPQLKQTFPTVSTTVIEWLVTIANLSALITLLLNLWLVKRWGIRKTVISAVVGIIPALTSRFVLVWNQLGKIGPQALTDNVLLWITFTLALLAVLTLLLPQKAR